MARSLVNKIIGGVCIVLGIFIGAIALVPGAPPSTDAPLGAISAVQTKSGNGGGYVSSHAFSFTSSVTSGNLIVIGVVTGTYAVDSITDTSSNSYIKIQDGSQTNLKGSLWYAYNVTGGTPTITIDLTGTSDTDDIAFVAREFSGIATTDPLDVSAENVESGYEITHTTGTTSTSDSGAYLVVGMYAGDSNATYSSADFSSVTSQNGNDLYEGIGLGHYDSSGASTHVGDFSTGATYTQGYGAIAVFLEGASATLEQEGFAFGDDDGSESAHTLDTQDTNVTEELGTKTLRALINATGDPASIAYKLKYQKNGSGGYIDVPSVSSAITTPVVESSDVTESGNNTTTESWSVSRPACVAGDMLIFHLASDADVTHDWSATGPNGETVVDLKDSIGGTAQRASGWYFICSGTTSSGTFTVTPSASEQWTAAVLKIPAGEYNTTTPIQTNRGEANDTTADTTWETPTWTSDATAGGRIVVFAAHDVVTTSATPTAWTTLVARDRGAEGLTLAVRNDANTASEVIASVNFTKTSETDSSFGYVINGTSTANQLYISASGNVASGGENTTARLSAPSGKTTGNFTTGRRWDDENGSDSIDIASDYYTELEWVLTTQSPATTDDYFEFRVYNADAAIDTYTVTPKWTIGTPASPGTTAPHDVFFF
jgi:hypothetical protein